MSKTGLKSAGSASREDTFHREQSPVLGQCFSGLAAHWNHLGALKATYARAHPALAGVRFSWLGERLGHHFCFKVPYIGDSIVLRVEANRQVNVQARTQTNKRGLNEHRRPSVLINGNCAVMVMLFRFTWLQLGVWKTLIPAGLQSVICCRRFHAVLQGPQSPKGALGAVGGTLANVQEGRWTAVSEAFLAFGGKQPKMQPQITWKFILWFILQWSTWKLRIFMVT